MTERPHFHFSLLCIGEGNGNPLQCSCLENPRDGGAWWAVFYGVAQSRTRLKWLSSSSSNFLHLKSVICVILWGFARWKLEFSLFLYLTVMETKYVEKSWYVNCFSPLCSLYKACVSHLNLYFFFCFLLHFYVWGILLNPEFWWNFLYTIKALMFIS